MADTGVEARKFKMSLEHLVVPGSMEVLKKNQMNGGRSTGHRNQPDRIYNDQSWNNISNKINNSVLYSYSKYK